MSEKEEVTEVASSEPLEEADNSAEEGTTTELSAAAVTLTSYQWGKS